MKRRRFFETLTAALLAVLIGAVPAAPTMAQGNSGKNKDKDDGGGDDGGTTAPPPVTYMVTWIDGFSVDTRSDHAPVNESLDMFGYLSPNTLEGRVIFYEGRVYLMGSFFPVGTSLRWIYTISDRTLDGSVYFVGTCDTADGIRGYVMKLTPDGSGNLTRTAFDVVQPLEGDDITALRSVNNIGQVVGYSRHSGDFWARTAVFLDENAVAVPFAFPVNHQHINNQGLWVGTVSDADGNFASYVGIPGGELVFASPMQNIYDVNSSGSFIGLESFTETDKKGNTTYVNKSAYFDGFDTSYEERDNVWIRGLNDSEDLLLYEHVAGKRNNPDYLRGLIYFSLLNSEFIVDDLLDSTNEVADVEKFLAENYKQFVDVKNDGTIVGTVTGDAPATFILTPVTP